MNINEYSKNPRYWAVWQKMQLLDIRDVSTDRQDNNGTIVWQLPIKNNWKNGTLIEVASFKTGYVRNQNSGYSNYQLNKRIFVDDYCPDYKMEQGHCVKTGKYTRYKTKSCVLIYSEIDRLEYLIGYCLKNYYIKNANQVASGKYVPQWYHEYKLEEANSPTVTRNLKKISELHDRIYELESQVDVADDKLVNSKDYTTDLKARLTKVTRECNHAYDCGLSDGEKKANETYSENTGAMERISELESQLLDYIKDADKIIDLKSQLDLKCDHYQNLLREKNDLENKLATIERIARINASYR